MSADPQPQQKRGLLVALVAGVFALVAVGTAALLANIAERKEAAKHQYVKVVEVTEADTDPAKMRFSHGSRSDFSGAGVASPLAPAPPPYLVLVASAVRR